MKKFYLLCLLTLLGIVGLRAEMVNMTITVDNARNVSLIYSNGGGDIIPLQTGENKLLLDNTKQPILVRAITPAKLEKVEVNGMSVNIQGGQDARIGIVQDNVVNIITSGTVPTSGVTIGVANPEWVIVKQSAGFGAELELKAGDTSFPVDDIKGPLQISAASGCQIIGIMQDGETLTPNASDVYSVSNLTEGTIIDINAREIPAAVPVMLSVPEDYNHLTVSNGSEPYEIEWDNGVATIMVTPGENLYFDVNKEDYKTFYIASFLNTSASYSVNAKGVYVTPVNQACSILVDVKPFEAGDGKWVVTFNTNSELISLYRIINEQREYLDPARGYLIPDDEKIHVFTFSSFTVETATLNGTPLSEEDPLPNSYDIPITQNSDIVIEGNVYVDVWCDRTVNDAFVEIGQVYVIDPRTGQRAISCKATPGSTLAIEAEASKGYLYDYSYLLSDPEQTFTDSVTIPENWQEEFFQIKGVFVEDSRKVFTVQGNTAFDPATLTQMGLIYITYDGKTQRAVAVPEGDEVTLVAEPMEGYEFVHFMFFTDTDRVIEGNKYVVNPDDANNMGVIDITGLFKDKDGGVTDIKGETISYINGIITAPGAITVYDLSGRIVATGSDALNLNNLPSGVYVAICNNKTLKINR